MRFLFSTEWTGPVTTNLSFLVRALLNLALSVSFFKLTRVEYTFCSLGERPRNPRCPFGSTSVSDPRRNGLGEVIISSASVLGVA